MLTHNGEVNFHSKLKSLIPVQFITELYKGKSVGYKSVKKSIKELGRNKLIKFTNFSDAAAGLPSEDDILNYEDRRRVT